MHAKAAKKITYKCSKQWKTILKKIKNAPNYYYATPILDAVKLCSKIRLAFDYGSTSIFCKKKNHMFQVASCWKIVTLRPLAINSSSDNKMIWFFFSYGPSSPPSSSSQWFHFDSRCSISGRKKKYRVCRYTYDQQMPSSSPPLLDLIWPWNFHYTTRILHLCKAVISDVGKKKKKPTSCIGRWLILHAKEEKKNNVQKLIT